MTRTEIANLALAKIGANLIATIDTQAAISLQLNQAARQALRGHDWNFAQAVEELAVIADPGGLPGTMTAAFALPGNYARRTALHFQGFPLEAVDFKILGHRIFTRTSELTLTYVRAEPPEAEWPDDFTEAVATLLASKLAGTLLKNAGMVRELFQTYLTIDLPEAKKNDAQDSPGSLYVHERAPYLTSPALNSRRARTTPGAYGIDAPASP